MKFIRKLTESVSWDKYNEEKFQRINNDYLPDTGEGDNMAQQIITAINKLIYKWYNDGDVYDNVMSNLEGWANDLSSYANWLHKHVPEVAPTLEDIEGVFHESKYEDILYKAANILFDLELLEAYEKNPKNGSIYDCEGPFQFTDDPYEDEEDEYDWGDSEEDSWDDDMDESKSIEEDTIPMTADEMKAKFGTDNPDIINTGRPEEDGTIVLKEGATTYIYLFPELTDEDIDMLKAYGLQFLGKNHGPDGSEDNWVVKGSESSLRMFADNYLGYELHPDYLYAEDDFAGDIEPLEEFLDVNANLDLHDFGGTGNNVSIL